MEINQKVVIVDYGMGNLRSVQKAIKRVGLDSEISPNLDVIKQADKLILPGVGHFANGVKKLKESGIWEALNKKVIHEKTPVLGICLGMQLMAKGSEEGNETGFGWFDAEVVKFKVSDTLKYKVPHMGWNQLIKKKKSGLLSNIAPEANFYFVHSFHVLCNDAKDELASTIYEYEFASAIQKENIYGVQFHPEKSHDAGEKMLLNFLSL